MGDVLLLQQAGQQLGGLDGGGAHQDRLPALMRLQDVGDDRVELLLGGTVDQVAPVLADHRLVGGDHHHFQVVDVVELVGLGVGGAGHAGQLAVEAEVVLEGDRGQRLVFLLDRHAFLGFHRLVQAVGPAAPGHHAAGELVDDDHLAVAHDVFHVALVQAVGAQQGVQVMDQHDAAGVVEALALAQQAGLAEQGLDLVVAGFRQVHLLDLLFGEEFAGSLLVLLRAEPRDQQVEAAPQLGIVVGGAADDQRCARLVDQDRVHLVDDGKGMAALHLVGGSEGQVVAQVVEAQLVVGGIGDVGAVGGALLRRRLARHHHAHGQSQEAVDAAHPLGVAARQVVVDGDDMHALAGQGIEIGRQGGNQGLALAGAHLRDLALVQDRAADQLHIEVAHAQHPLAGLAHHREGLRHQLVQGLAFIQALAEQPSLPAQLGIAHLLVFRLQRIDLRHQAIEPLHQPLIAAAENAREQRSHLSLWERRESSGGRIMPER